MIRVYLLDDHEVVRRGLRELLQSEGDIKVIGESDSAEQARRSVPILKPDVAILDTWLPDGYGVDVCRDIRAVDPTIKVLILASREDQQVRAVARRAGAAGCLLKESRGADLLNMVRRVASGAVPPAAAAAADAVSEAEPADSPQELQGLTSQERRILALIAEGLTNRQIAEQMFLAEKTVKNYVSNLLAKLGLERRTQAAVLVTRVLSRGRS